MSGSGTGAISSWLAAAYEEEREGGREGQERKSESEISSV